MKEQNAKTDVLFIFCPYVGHWMLPHKFEINLGVAYLAAYLKDQGLRASFYDGRYDNDPAFRQAIAYIKKTAPRMVGFTVYGSNLPETVALSGVIKNKFPNILIVWGGPELRFRAQELLEQYGEYIDACVVGEGEKPLLHLLNADMPWSDGVLEIVPGIAFQHPSNGHIVANNPENTILQDAFTKSKGKKTLDVYPSPYLEGMIPDQYIKENTIQTILSSRGCPYNCIYCQFSALTDHKIHFHSVERVLAEIRWIHQKLRRFHPEKDEFMIMILDDAFTFQRKRIEELCHRLIQQDFKPPLKLWIDTRADRIDEALLKLLKRAGTKKINFGLESAVPRILKIIRKASNKLNRKPGDVAIEKRFLNQIKQAVKWSKDAGINTSVSIIVGLPTETMDDAQATLRFVEELDVDFYYHNFINVLEGTELAQRSEEFGYQWVQHLPGYMGKYGQRYTDAPIPARSLKPLKNDIVFEREQSRFGVLLRGWSYIWKFGQLPNSLIKFRPFALGMQAGPVGSKIQDHFFSHYAGLSATLFCNEDSQLPDDVFAKMIRNLPFKNGRYLVMPAPGSDLKRIKGLEETDHSTPYFIPFKNLTPDATCDDERRIFVTITDYDDFERLKKFVKNFNAKNKKGLTYPKAQLLPFDLFECCHWFRWLEPTCPAALLTHLYCDDKGALYPCTFFPAVGTLDENVSLQTLRKRIEKHIEKKAAERGCDTCPAQSYCPQCPAPLPLTDEQYCAFQLGLRT